MLQKIQIGVFGSAADLKYSKQLEKMAEEVGYLIAKNGGILIFGLDKDYDSLGAVASRGAKRAGGITVGITYGRREKIENGPDVLITSGMERGGGREYIIGANCDAAIAISGGSGTLNEISVAYQLGIPIIGLKGSGGWTEKLLGQYLDNRRRLKIIPASDAKEAVELAFREAEFKSIK